ncbi:hypothetical protein [Desulfoscipio sp. XC116]|uniref:hypothetical protein n=1 Tax=Desulfoscipio sp. XC116 TaxID=3144975 RepID=UPI00325A5121
MGSISGLLITVRTSRQGAAMEKGKFCDEYIREISTLAVSPEDFALLHLEQGNKALLKSAAGEITVTCRPKEGPQGLFFLPLGPLANRLISGETYGTGVPDFKGISVVLSSLKPDGRKLDE